MKKSNLLVMLVHIFFGGLLVNHSYAEESGPPELYTEFSSIFSLPVPISPLGPPLVNESKSDVTFEWTKVDAADTYVLWIEESNGITIHRVLKAGLGSEDLEEEYRYECNDATCKTEGVNLTAAEGQWWIQAIHLAKKKRSGWSKKGHFGTKGDLYARCVKPLDKFNNNYSVETGDLPWTRNEWANFSTGEWTVGLAALAQVIKYDFAKKKAGFNNGLGAGASFRFYRDVYVAGEEQKVPISRINRDCRARTFQLRDDTDLPDAAPVFSVTPVVFASQIVGEDDLRVELAIMFGFFEDIINIGGGFNLTGKDGDVGDVFLLFSIGAGFNF